MIRKPIAAALLVGAAFLSPFAAAAEAPATDPAVLALGEVPQGRLSDAVKPLAYRVDTRFDPALKGFSGSTEIDVELAAPSTFIDLHGRNLNILSAVARKDGKVWTGRWHQTDRTGVARLVFDEPLPAGPLTLGFTYLGTYQDGPSGLFHAEVEGQWYGWSQFQSIDARAAFPGFDEPGFKVPFTVTIRTRPGQVAVSNAPEVSSTLEDGWQVHRFAPTLPLPTYLVAMMAGPFAVAEGVVPPTPQRSTPLPLRIVSPQSNAARLDYALEQSKPIVALLEDYFGQAFPYPKLDQISSPLMGGAMENAGADLYSDSILIVDDNAPLWQRKLFGMVVSHELAHQWFGDLVTPAWWDDLWLNESFANWMGFTIGGAWRPDLKIGEGALGEGFAAMRPDSLLAGRPIHQPIATNGQIDSAFDGITYGKGGHVVAMIAAYMGPEKFRAGVRSYMAAHRYGNATSTDFFAAMAEAAGDPRITQAMQGFTDQQGVPLVTLTGADGRYALSQSRYAPLGVEAPATRWDVPVCLRRDGARECTLLTAEGASVTLGGTGAVMPNAGGTGYYRFELPAAEWDALIATADRLSGPEAMALSDSLIASFHAGRATPQQLVALTLKLNANPDAQASKIAYNGFGPLRRAGFFSESATTAYRAWIGRLARQKLSKLGFDPKLGAYQAEDVDVAQQRELMVSDLLLARDAELTDRLAAAASAYLAGDSAALDPTYLEYGLDAYVAKGGLAAAKAVADKALSSQDPIFRPAALQAVYGSGNAEIARWALDGFKDSRLRQTERLYIALGITAVPETRAIGYAWLTGHMEEMMNGSSGIFLARAIPATVAGFCSAEMADEMAPRFRAVFAGTPGALEFERTLETVRNCAALKQARGAELDAVLKAL